MEYPLWQPGGWYGEGYLNVDEAQPQGSRSDVSRGCRGVESQKKCTCGEAGNQTDVLATAQGSEVVRTPYNKADALVLSVRLTFRIHSTTSKLEQNTKVRVFDQVNVSTIMIHEFYASRVPWKYVLPISRTVSYSWHRCAAF